MIKGLKSTTELADERYRYRNRQEDKFIMTVLGIVIICSSIAILCMFRSL